MADLRFYALGVRYGYSDLSFFWKYSLQSDHDRAACLAISDRDIIIQLALEGHISIPPIEKETIRHVAKMFSDALFHSDGACCLNSLEKRHGPNSQLAFSMIRIMERKLCYLRAISSVWNRVFLLIILSSWQTSSSVSFFVILFSTSFVVFADIKFLVYLRKLIVRHVLVFFDYRSIPISHATGMQGFLVCFLSLGHDACMLSCIRACIYLNMGTAINSNFFHSSKCLRWNTTLHNLSNAILGVLTPVSLWLDSSPWKALGVTFFLHQKLALSILSYLVLGMVVGIALVRDISLLLRKNPSLCYMISIAISLIAFGVSRVFPGIASAVWKVTGLLVCVSFLPLLTRTAGRTDEILSKLLQVFSRSVNYSVCLWNYVAAILIVSKTSVRLGLQFLRVLQKTKRID